jgi:hypothetical protein
LLNLTCLVIFSAFCYKDCFGKLPNEQSIGNEFGRFVTRACESSAPPLDLNIVTRSDWHRSLE